MERLFVAVWPPADVVDALGRVDLGEDVRPVRPERLHVTLRFLDDADPAAVAAALGAVELPAATARVGGQLGLLGRDAVVVPVDGLDALAAAVADATGGPSRRFVAHLTLGRTRQRTRPHGDVPLRTFVVGGVDLVRSAHGAARPGEPFYTTVHNWPTATT